jgi:hypothetical protein
MGNDKPTIMPPVPVIASIDSLIVDQIEDELENRDSDIFERLEIERAYYDEGDML